MAATMGRQGFVSFDGTTTAAGLIDSWSLSPAIGTAEITAYGNNSKAFVSTIKEWTVTAGGTLDKTNTQQNTIFQKLDSTSAATAASLRLYDSTSYWAGSAFITSYNVNSQVGDKVSVTFNFQGTGDLSYVTT
jgi:hypothetical protein